MIPTGESVDIGQLWGRLLLFALMGAERLEVQLRQASAESCVRALSALGDWPEATLQAGQALEHLAKAEVFARDPEGLTLPSKGPSAAFLRGDGHPEIRHVGQVFSIGGRQAVNLAFSHRGLPPPGADDLAAVFDARNASAHLGFADRQTAAGAVGAMARLVTALLETRGESIGTWTGQADLGRVADLLAAVPLGLDSYVRSHEARVRAKLWAAKERWAELRDRLPDEAWQTAARWPLEPEWTEERQLRPCPSGQHMAWYVVRWDKDDVQDNDDPDSLRDEISYIGGMTCSLCGLDLADDEVAMLGLDEVLGHRTVER